MMSDRKLATMMLNAVWNGSTGLCTGSLCGRDDISAGISGNRAKGGRGQGEVRTLPVPVLSARLSATCTSIDGRNYETMCCLYPYASAFAFPRVYDA